MENPKWCVVDVKAVLGREGQEEGCRVVGGGFLMRVPCVVIASATVLSQRVIFLCCPVLLRPHELHLSFRSIPNLPPASFGPAPRACGLPGRLP